MVMRTPSKGALLHDADAATSLDAPAAPMGYRDTIYVPRTIDSSPTSAAAVATEPLQEAARIRRNTANSPTCPPRRIAKRRQPAKESTTCPNHRAF
jgi:hypothetical protein